MISKIFSLRNYVMKQIMRPNKEGIMKIPDKGKVDFGEMLIKEELFKKGIDPKAITSAKQLDNILNTPSVSPHSPPKKSGEVIDVDFDKGRWKDIDPEDFAHGGRTGFFTGALVDTEKGKSMSPGTSHDYSPGQGHRATADANKQLAEVVKMHNMKTAPIELKPPKKTIRERIGGGINSFFNNPLVRGYAAIGSGGLSEKLRASMMAKQLYDNRNILVDNAIEEEVSNIPTMGGITPAYAHGGRTGTGLNYLLGEDDQNSRVPYGSGGAGKPPVTFTLTGGGGYGKNQNIMDQGQIIPGLNQEQYGYGFDLGANIDLPWGLSLKGGAGIGRGSTKTDYRGRPIGGMSGVGETKLGDKWNVGIQGKWPVNFNKLLMGKAEGGRIGLGLGGISKARRAFLKLMGGAAAGTAVAKSGLFSLLKGGAKKQVIKDLTSVPIKAGADGMPVWFKPLVNKVIKDGTDVTKELGTIERQLVHKTKLPNSKTDVYVTQDLNTGDVLVDIGAGKHGFAEGHLGQPVRLNYKASEVIEPSTTGGGYMTKGGENVYPGMSKGALETTKKGKVTKTKEEFWVEEAEFTGGHPENVKFEESISEKFGQHGSNFDEVEKFATGKIKKKTAKESLKAERSHWVPEGDDMASGGRVPLRGGGGPDKLEEAIRAYRKYQGSRKNPRLNFKTFFKVYAKENFASGGRVPLGKGKLALEGLEALMKKFFPGTTKLGKTSRPMAEKTQLRKAIADFQEREKVAKLKADKDRAATADELEEYGSILDPSGEAYIVEEGMTIGQLDDMVKEHYAYVDDMYQRYKKGDLEKYVKPEVLQEQKAFYQKKIDNVLETAYDDVAGGSGFTGDYKYDADVLAESIAEQLGKVYDDLPVMDQRQLYESALKRISNDMKMKMDIKKLSKPTKTLEGIEKTGTINISDPNVADEFSRFMKESDPKGFKDLEQKVELSNLDIKGKKGHAEGGIIDRVPYWTGGSWKMIKEAIEHNKIFGLGGPPYKPGATSFDIKQLTKDRFGSELSLQELKEMGIKEGSFSKFKTGFKEYKAGVIKQQLLDSKHEAKIRIKVSKEMLETPPKGVDSKLNKQIQEQMIRDSEKRLKDLDAALKDIDVYKAMKEKTGVASHASGGRVPLSAGGLAGMLGE